jgi:hypothetical protein
MNKQNWSSFRLSLLISIPSYFLINMIIVQSKVYLTPLPPPLLILFLSFFKWMLEVERKLSESNLKGAISDSHFSTSISNIPSLKKSQREREREIV